MATELPLKSSDTSMGVKQSSLLTLTMYVCMYEIQNCQDPVKGSRWGTFPSTMAEQHIQQMVVGHLCFQELTDVYL